VIDKVVVGAAESGQIVGAIDVFSKLRSKGLISGIPVVGSGNVGGVGVIDGGGGELSISGMEYEQVTSDSPPGTPVEKYYSAKKTSSSTRKNQEFKNKFPASTTSLTDTDTDSDTNANDTLDRTSEYSDTEIEGEGEEAELLPESASNTARTRSSRFRSSRKSSTVGPSSPAAAQSLYTSLIVGAHKARLDEPMKRLYTWLHEDGLLPNRPIMSRMAACLPYVNDPAGALQMYGYIRKLDIPMDAFMYGHVIAALLVGSQGQEWWDTALLLTHRMHIAVTSSHDTSVQTSMVVNAGKNGWIAELLALYNLMLQDGVMPRPITWNAFITAAVRCNRPDVGFAFGVAMRKMGCSMDAATHSALFSCAAAQGDAEAAQKQWKAMLEDNIAPDSIACSSYMWACLCGGRAQIAIEFFESWRKDRKPPGWHDKLTSGRAATAGGGSVTTSAAPTYSEVCTALLKGGRWDRSRIALQLQRWIKGQGEDPRSINLDQLRARGVSRGGRWAQASALADEAVRAPAPVNPPEPDSVSISFAATGYAQLGNETKALQLADELSSMDIPLHSAAFSTALDGCAAAGAFDAALKLLRRARIAGIRPDSAAYGAAISAAAPQGSVSAALMVLNWMAEDGVQPNIIAVNSALAVCAVAIDPEAALTVFRRMKADWGIDPDPIAYATLCEVLAKAGRWSDAVRAMLVAEHTLESIYKSMSLLKLCDTDPPKINIDLHGLSVAAASTAVRAWLLALRRSSAVASGEIDGEQVTIVTGRGRNSLEGLSKLKPGIELLFKKGLGGKRSFNFTTPSENPGQLSISGADLRAGLEDSRLDLGFGIKEKEDEIWNLVTGKTVPTFDVIPKPKPKQQQQQQ
jgi:tetratricopeptide (TPR) repeat protein